MADLAFPIERSSRRHDWRPGVAVVLANGEVWHIPYAYPGPIEEAGDGWASVSMQVHGKRSEEVTEAYYWPRELTERRGKLPPHPLGDYFRVVIGAALLRSNYHVTHSASLALLWHAFVMRDDMASMANVLAAIRRAFDQDGLAKIEAGIPRKADDN